ncbi:MAG: hypothetical protein AB1505_06100 [Candidatus Latescibacterota bacterium]
MPVSQPNRPLFLMDSRLVESSRGVRLDVSPPAKAGPVLIQEAPWESFYMQPHSLVRLGGEYLLYYLVYIVNDGPHRTATCLATSPDGLHWHRPGLGQVEYAGSRANNILPVSGTVTVSVDPCAPPERRLLMAGNDSRTSPGEPGFVVESLALHTSPDGRVWTQASPALLPFSCDTTNQVFHDPARGTYVAYLRAFPGRRAVAYYETRNPFVPWPIQPSEANRGEVHATPHGSLRVVYIVDELPLAIDGSQTHQVYSPGVVPLEGLYLAFPHVFRLFPGPHHPDREAFPDSELYRYWNDGLVAPRLYVSEEGVSFRPVGSRPYLDLGCGDDLDTRQARMVPEMIAHGTEIWQYYGGHQTSHRLADAARPRRKCAVMRAIQRRDRFAGMVCCSGGGEIVTTPVACAGRRLCVNYDAGAWGEVRVELLGEDRRPIPGFSLSDSAALIGNEIYAQVQWSHRRDLQPLHGRGVRVRLLLDGAALYSLKFE